MNPLPAHLHNAARINWHITSWCNYSCEYCPVVVFHQRSKTGQAQPHAFDYHPVSEWLRMLRQFPFRRIHLTISGGEPFLDRTNFHALLSGLSAMESVDATVITNGFWDPAHYADVDKSRLSLVVTFHPCEIPLENFLNNLRRIRNSGFRISMVNFVLAPENMVAMEETLWQLEREGFFVNVSSMMSAGVYSSRSERTELELDLIERYNTPCDNYFKLVRPRTRGSLCFYPAMTYYLLFDGSIQVACMDDTARNLFTGGIPALPREAVPCAYEQCVGCSDMYRGLVDHPRVETPLGFFGNDDYVAEVGNARNEYRAASDRSRFSVRSMLKDAGSGRLVSIELPDGSAPLPEQPVFGFNDHSKFVARSRDRISISGWAASRKDGAPVQEIRIKVDGRDVGVVRDFFDRPDVAKSYGRPDFLKSGWRGMVYLPALSHGEYELIPHAFDALGNYAALPASRISIVD